MIKILVVDDELPIANLIRMNLARQGYAVTCAYDGQEAADLLENNTFDLVLLDIMLPKFDGYDLLSWDPGEHELQGGASQEQALCPGQGRAVGMESRLLRPGGGEPVRSPGKIGDGPSLVVGRKQVQTGVPEGLRIVLEQGPEPTLQSEGALLPP